MGVFFHVCVGIISLFGYNRVYIVKEVTCEKENAVLALDTLYVLDDRMYGTRRSQ